MGDGNNFILLLRKGLFDFRHLGSSANRSLQLGRLGSIRGQAIGEAVTKVAGTQYQSILASLDQVGSYQIPAQCTGAADDERLGSRVGGLEERAK